jgi:hypothetical protein
VPALLADAQQQGASQRQGSRHHHRARQRSLGLQPLRLDRTGERQRRSKSHADDDIVAIYDYDGFQKVRYRSGHEPRFRIRHRDGNGWKWGAGGADTDVLYRKDEIDEAIAAEHTVLAVEGEKDVESARRIGIPATCNSQGASEPDKKPKWKGAHSEQLRGADLVVIPDHDPPGYAHADAICRMSLGIAKRVRRLDLAKHWPECSKGGDLSDWLAAGGTREQLDALIDQAPDYQGEDNAKAPRKAPPTSAEALHHMTFAPIKYVVPGVIVEGLTLLAGKPKIGKSWLLLHTAIAVARGGFTLGDIHCIEGDVLYCALEDNLRRLQSRMTKLIGISQPWPKRLQFHCEMPRLSEGGLDVIKDWIESVEHPRLIIIDILASVRAPKKREQTQYDADYEAVLELRKLANERGLAIIVVHHQRKMEADDPFDTISGTLGLTGVPDSVLVLKYDRGGSGTVVLHGRGRDLMEIEKAVAFNKDTCVWTITGDVPDVRSSRERKKVLAAMQEINAPASANEIATSSKLKKANVRRMLERMAKDGAVVRCGRGKYELPTAEGSTTSAQAEAVQ